MVNRERKIRKLYPQGNAGIYAMTSIPTEGGVRVCSNAASPKFHSACLNLRLGKNTTECFSVPHHHIGKK